MKAIVINTKFLRVQNACEAQRRKFTRVFGRGNVPINITSARKAIKAGLIIDWLAYRLLPCSITGKVDRQLYRTEAFKAHRKLMRAHERADEKLCKKLLTRRIDIAKSLGVDLYSSVLIDAAKKDPQCRALRKQIDALYCAYEKAHSKLAFAKDVEHARLLIPHVRKALAQYTLLQE